MTQELGTLLGIDVQKKDELWGLIQVDLVMPVNGAGGGDQELLGGHR